MTATSAAAADRRRDVRVGDTFMRGMFLYRIVGFAPCDGEAQTSLVRWHGIRPEPTLMSPPSRDETGRLRAEPA